jgi:acetyl esterase/lipase
MASTGARDHLYRYCVRALLVGLSAALVFVSGVTSIRPQTHASAADSGLMPLLDQWSPTTQVFRNPDGTLTAEVHAGPIQAPDPTSATGWSPIDTTLQATQDGFVPDQTDASIQLSDGSDSGPLASVQQAGNTLSVDWGGDLPAPSISGDTATYADVLPGVDATVQANPQGFEQSFVVHALADAPQTLEIPLQLDGLTASLTTDGGLVLTDDTGTVVGGADPALMWGSAVDPDTGEPTAAATVATSLVEGADGPILRLTPDPSFFTDPAVTYPVTIDPTVSLTLLLDTSIDSSNPNTSYGTATTLRAGKVGSAVYRSLIGFDRAAIAGTHVLSASLVLYESGSASCNAKQVDAFGVTNTVTPPFTWNNKPTEGYQYASATAAMGYSGSCAAGTLTLSTGGASSTTLTDLVQRWANDLSPAIVEIRAHDEADTDASKIFRSSDAGSNGPVLSVTYNSYPFAPSGLRYSGGSLDTVMLHGTFVDPDGGTGSVQYTVYDDQGAAVLTASGPTVASGVDSPYDVPEGVLDAIHTYTWKARALDGLGLPSVYSAVQTLSPDLCAGNPTSSTATATYKHFKTSPTGSSIPILLDQYDPVVAQETFEPAIVMVHGGGWTRGCRRLLDKEAVELAKAGYIVFSIDYRLACSGYEPNFSSEVTALCGWYFQRQSVETGLPAVAAQDVQEAIAWVRLNVTDYWGWWNGKVAAVGESAGGNILLEAVATTSDSTKKPDVVATWSGKIEMGRFIQRPNDGITSDDTCDHSHKSGPNFEGVTRCWTGEDFYLNSVDYSQTPPNPPTPVCGIPRDPVNSKPCADAQPWIDAAPYTQWNAGSHSTLPPAFFSNAGGPDPNIYANAETVPLQEAIEFRNLLVLKGFLQGVDMDFCVVDSKLHGSKYLFDPALSCETHPGEFVFTSTLNFFNRFTRP